MIYAVRPYDIQFHWHAIAPLIARVLPLDPNPPSLDYVRERLETGQSFCLVAVDDENPGSVIAVCTMFINDRQEVIGEYMAGTDMTRWVAELSAATDRFARDNGCKVIRTFARKGWTPVGKKFGYVDAGVTLFTKHLVDD